MKNNIVSIEDPLKHLKNKIEQKENQIKQNTIIWKNAIQEFDKDGNLRKVKIIPTSDNLKCLLDFYNVEVKFNKLTKSVEYYTNNFEASKYDYYNSNLVYILDKCAIEGFKITDAKAGSFINSIASKNEYNPVVEYLEEVHMDYLENKHDYIGDLVDTLELADFDKDFAKLLITKWLISCVALPLNDGGKVEGVLLLQSEAQGIGKTEWFARLFPNSEWFKRSSHLDPANKDTILESIKYWVVELGEAETTLKKTQGLLKAFITNHQDEIRKPYGASAEKFPRLTVFCGTINPKEFLKDETGSRRWWVIPVTDINQNLYNSIDKNLLWGQVVELFYQGHSFELTRTERELLEKGNSSFETKETVEEYLQDFYDFKNEYRRSLTFSELISEIQSLLDRKNIKINISSYSKTKLGLIIKRAGIDKTQSKEKIYFVPELRPGYKTIVS